MAEEVPKAAAADVQAQDHAADGAPVKRVWYHTTLFNAFVIGVVGKSHLILMKTAL